eukprot:UN26745
MMNALADVGHMPIEQEEHEPFQLDENNERIKSTDHEMAHIEIIRSDEYEPNVAKEASNGDNVDPSTVKYNDVLLPQSTYLQANPSMNTVSVASTELYGHHSPNTSPVVKVNKNQNTQGQDDISMFSIFGYRDSKTKLVKKSPK